MVIYGNYFWVRHFFVCLFKRKGKWTFFHTKYYLSCGMLKECYETNCGVFFYHLNMLLNKTNKFRSNTNQMYGHLMKHEKKLDKNNFFALIHSIALLKALNTFKIMSWLAMAMYQHCFALYIVTSSTSTHFFWNVIWWKLFLPIFILIYI